MSVKPQQVIIEKNISGLGFKVKEPNTKQSKIDLSLMKGNMQLMLMLSYYSLQLCPMFINEGCISCYCQNYFEKRKEKPIGHPMNMHKLTEVIKIYSDLLQNEHSYSTKWTDVNEESIAKRL